MKLTKTELREAPMMTWGRIRAQVGLSQYGKVKLNQARLIELIKLFDLTIQSSILPMEFTEKRKMNNKLNLDSTSE